MDYLNFKFTNVTVLVKRFSKCQHRVYLLDVWWITCTEQYCFLIFFNRLWSVATALTLDAQNPEIRMRMNIKPNGKQKLKRRQKKITFFFASHQSAFVPEKHSS